MAETELKWYPAKVLDTITESVAARRGRGACVTHSRQRGLDHAV